MIYTAETKRDASNARRLSGTAETENDIRNNDEKKYLEIE